MEAVDNFLQHGRDASCLERFERSNRRYQRDLFAALRMMYRLMRDYGTVLAFIMFTGLGFRSWRHPIFQRIGMDRRASSELRVGHAAADLGRQRSCLLRTAARHSGISRLPTLGGELPDG